MVDWPTKALICAVNERLHAEHGGSASVLDEDVLDAAIARPQLLLSHGETAPDLADLAASLAHGLAFIRPFTDGNKRTAHVCYRAFLILNSMTLVASDEDKYVTTLALAEGSLSEADFAAWLRQHIRLDAGKDVHEKRARYGG